MTVAEQIMRKDWIRILAHSERKDIEAACQSLSPFPEYRLVRGPEIGMVMVQGRTGGVGAPFNLGEATVTRCTLQVDQGAAGTAYILGRDRRHAELAALLDALLLDPNRQPDVMAIVVRPLASILHAREAEQAQKTAATKVEFFTMARETHQK
jgi:alpha-D-ribose 1-methylphosphonate 5-triphosphate synthase subunit PhnG